MLMWVRWMILWCLCCPVISWADILTLRDQYPGILPLTGSLIPEEEPRIRMEGESVLLDCTKLEQLTCTFSLRSYAHEPLTRTVAFPITYPQNAPAFRDFHPQHRTSEFTAPEYAVTINGHQVATTCRMLVDRSQTPTLYWRPDFDAMRYAGYVCWPMSWQPGETHTVRFTSNSFMAYDRPANALVDGRRVRYIVRTGRLWRGTIGTADIRMILVPGISTRPRADEADTVFRLSYPKQAQWVTDNEVRWQFIDWEPTDDIWVERLHWVGVRPNYFFLLPQYYQSATLRYSQQFLDSLIERELAPWKAVFPQQVAAMDRTALGKRIADCLMHEISARHGLAYTLEKPLPSSTNTMPVADTTATQHSSSEWFWYFQPYQKVGGWYHPTTSAVPLAAFNEIEQANLSFLKDIVEAHQ